jgi:hypothetical protein
LAGWPELLTHLLMSQRYRYDHNKNVYHVLTRCTLVADWVDSHSKNGQMGPVPLTTDLGCTDWHYHAGLPSVCMLPTFAPTNVIQQATGNHCAAAAVAVQYGHLRL